MVSFWEKDGCDLTPADPGLVHDTPSRNSMNICRPAAANLTTPPVIRLSRSDYALTQTANQRQPAVSLVSQRFPDSQCPVPRHPANPRPLSHHPQTTLSATHLIRLLPHTDSDDFFWFDPISREVEEGNSPLRIGRPSRRSDLNELSFKPEVVSRAHAEIWAEAGGKIFIRDTKSASGTFLNHIRLSPADRTSPPFELKDGDILQLGRTHGGGTEDKHKCVKIKVEIKKELRASLNAFMFVSSFHNVVSFSD